jgi:hypothetical protein
LAGLGRKEFNSGDILLASEVQGYLQDQAVMVFDDATARGSAIPSPSEGMLTYNKDTDQLELYDGSAFGPVGSDSGLIHINTTSFSAVASQSVNDVFSATYDNYRILVSWSASVGDIDLSMRLRVGGTDNTTSNYNMQRLDANATGVAGERTANQTSFNRVASQGTLDFNNYSQDVFKPFLATPTHFNLVGMASRSSSYIRFGVGGFNATTSFDGFTIFPASGNITGSISVFGYQK